MLPLGEPHLVVNADTRTINIPNIFKSAGGAGLSMDQIAETLIFEIDRYYDFIDLATTGIFVQWKSPLNDKEGKASQITLVDFNDKKIKFGWPLTQSITEKEGKVQFSVRFVLKNDEGQVVYSLNTLPATIEIKKALIPDFNHLEFDDGSEYFDYAVLNGISSNPSDPPSKPVIITGLPEYSYLIEDENDMAKEEVTLKVLVGTVDGQLEYEWSKVLNESGSGETKLGGGKPMFISIGTKTPDFDNGQTYYIKNDDENGYEIVTSDTYEEGVEVFNCWNAITIESEEGNKDVTGKYKVVAINKFNSGSGTRSEPVFTIIPAPESLDFTTNLADGLILEEGKAELKVAVKKDTHDGHNVISYQWQKADNEDEYSDIEANEQTYEANAIGWYRCNITNSMNGKEEVMLSNVCKVTNEPAAPVISYPAAGSDVEIKVENSGTVQELKVTLDDEKNQFDNKLLSESVDYKWYVGKPDDAIEDKEAIVDGTEIIEINKDIIKIIVPVDTVRHYYCKVINTLNGKTAEAISGHYYVIG